MSRTWKRQSHGFRNLDNSFSIEKQLDEKEIFEKFRT